MQALDLPTVPRTIHAKPVDPLIGDLYIMLTPAHVRSTYDLYGRRLSRQ